MQSLLLLIIPPFGLWPWGASAMSIVGKPLRERKPHYYMFPLLPEVLAAFRLHNSTLGACFTILQPYLTPILVIKKETILL